MKHNLIGCCDKCNSNKCDGSKMQCCFTRCTICKEEDSTVEGEQKLDEPCRGNK